MKESGFETRAVKLLALFDKQKHEHPPEWPHAYKCFFLCELIGAVRRQVMKLLRWNFLPGMHCRKLSINRVTKSADITIF